MRCLLAIVKLAIQPYTSEVVKFDESESVSNNIRQIGQGSQHFANRRLACCVDVWIDATHRNRCCNLLLSPTMADRPSSVRLPLNVLNPGTSTRRGRRSCCRCLIWTVFIVAAFCTAWISLFVGWSFRQWISNIRSPHKEHYFNATQDPLPNLIVRPLIDENQTFDIAVSVWLKATEEEEAVYRRNRAADVVIGDKGEGILTKIDVPPGIGDANDKIEDPQDEREDILETPLFSDIVFRGLRLKDKGISQKVQFRLPTARLYVAY